MGVEWPVDTPRVSNLGQPRISPRETRREGEPPTDYELAAAERHVDTALEEGERNRRMIAEAERLYRVSFTEVEQRALVLHELAGAAQDQQTDELRALAALITTALGRAQILDARRGGLGLFRQVTGQPLPPYVPHYEDDPCQSCGSYVRAERRTIAPHGVDFPCRDAWHEGEL